MNTPLETGTAIVARNETESLLKFEHFNLLTSYHRLKALFHVVLQMTREFKKILFLCSGFFTMGSMKCNL